MSVEAMQAKARAHWSKWLPTKVAELKASGTLEETLRAAAIAAQRTIEDLMAQGYQMHEAEEVALKEHVLLKPEAGADVEDWEAKELADLDRQYRSEMKGK